MGYLCRYFGAQGNPVADGINLFVVGQEGRDHDSSTVVDAGKSPPPADSVDARDNTRSGVPKLTLGADSYDWESRAIAPFRTPAANPSFGSCAATIHGRLFGFFEGEP